MEWTTSLKRTRNGSIYSDTMSTLTRLSGRENKRRKTLAEGEQSVAPPCYLESLPAELLQQIFLTSMNGNLLTASPRIAVKLSGSKAVYHAAFLLAFYSHDADNMFNIYDLNYLVPILDLPFSSWDVRSLTRAILGSRWCTWGLVKSWLADNLRYAVTQLLAVATPSKSGHNIEEFMRGETHLESLVRRAWWAKDIDDGRSWQLETCMWDIRLLRDSDLYDSEKAREADHESLLYGDAFHAEWTFDISLQFQMRIFGVLTIGEEKSQSLEAESRSSDPFRDVVKSLAGLSLDDMRRQPSSLDYWQLLEERAIRATRNPQWLRETLAIQYFFYPEDQPFKVSPALYRAAALADLNLEEALYDGTYIPVLHVLFQVDPLSLPRKDPALLAWAAKARRRILDFVSNLQDMRAEIDEQKIERGGMLNNLDRHRYRARKLEHKFRGEMDWKILNHISKGLLDGNLQSQLAPDFREPLAWLGERLNPSAQALDAAEMLPYPRSSARDVDIFGDDPDYGWDCYYELEDETANDLIPNIFGPDYQQLDYEANISLGKLERSEGLYALTSRDEYYNSLDHDGYAGLFHRPVESVVGFLDPWNSDEGGDSDEADGDNETEVELLHDTPLVIHRHLEGVDLAISFLEDLEPLPLKDTELIEPIYGPPKWFHAVEKSYCQEL